MARIIPASGAWPVLPQLSGAASVISFFTMDGVDERSANIFIVPKTGNIRYIWWKLAAITTGITAGSPVTLAAYQVDTSTGTPAATPVLYNAACTAVNLPEFSGTDDYTAYRTDLGAGNVLPVTKGDPIALTFTNPVANSPNWRGASLTMCVEFVGGTFPYLAIATGSPSTWSKGLNTSAMSVEYTDGSVYCVGQPVTSAGSVWETSIATPNKAGVEITPLWDMYVTQLAISAELDGNADLVLYDNRSGQVLGTASHILNVRGSTSNAVHFFNIPPVWLRAGWAYAVMVCPTSATACKYLPLAVYDPNTNTEQALDGGWRNYGGTLLTGTAWPFTRNPLKRLLSGVRYSAVRIPDSPVRTRGVVG